MPLLGSYQAQLNRPEVVADFYSPGPGGIANNSSTANRCGDACALALATSSSSPSRKAYASSQNWSRCHAPARLGTSVAGGLSDRQHNLHDLPT